MKYVCDGLELEFGFDTKVSTTDIQTKECKNLLSARMQPDIVAKLLKDGCDKGYAYGPFLIGVATGKYSDKKRLIINLSAPHNDLKHVSINDLIDKDQCSFTYVKLDDAIKRIRETGQSALLCSSI